MRFIPLASSSAGNAYLVEAPGAGVLLLECGLSYKRLRSLAGYRLHELCGCLITHEHKDHSRCWADLIKSGVRVWTSAGTREKLGEGGSNAALIDALPEREETPPAPCGGPPLKEGGLGSLYEGAVRQSLTEGALRSTVAPKPSPYIPFSVGSFEVLPFDTFHDAEQPVGYLIRAGREKLAFATDTVSFRYKLPGVNILAIEANYDRGILARCERMPDKVKQRVRNSHMEIGTLCAYLQEADLSACREIYLLHLSDASANEGDFIRRVRAVVPKGTRVTACGK